MATAVSHAARWVGSSVDRKEDKRLLTGHGRYVADVVRPGMFHGAFLRSDVAAATIRDIDTSAARALPGVAAVYTAADFAGGYGEAWHSILGEELPVPAPLADVDVRYVGDPIALVVAESRYVAEDACELIAVDLDVTDPCVDLLAAADDREHLVHGASGGLSNVMRDVSFTTRQSDFDEAFASASHVIETEVRSHRYVAVPLETRGIVAEWSAARDEVDITCANQKVHQAREFFARYLELPQAGVRVWARDVGGGFGQKGFIFREECAVVLAARSLGRPVKWVEDRRENLISAGHSRNEHGRVRLAIDDEHAIQAIAIDHLADVGAYPICPSAVMDAQLLPGPYRIPRLGYSSRSVRTNTMGLAAYRGPWLFETTAREMAIDHTARVLGVDPIGLRRKNLLSAIDLPFSSPGGYLLQEITPRETLERALEILNYDAFRAEQTAARSAGKLVGLGCCVYVEPTAAGAPTQASDGAAIKIDTGGKVTAYVGTTAHGQSVETTMAQIVADTLGVDYDDVTVVQGQTEGTPYGRGTGGSGTAVITGGAAREAAEQLRARVVDLAAHLLEADPRDLTVADGRVHVNGAPSASVTLGELATAAYRFDRRLPVGMMSGLEAVARFRPSSFPTWSNATHLCVVEIDPRSCVATVVRYVVVEDCGPLINPKVAEGQICGGVVQGLGGVLYESFVYEPSGNPLTATLVDYLLPTSAEVPEIEASHIETLATSNPGGFKGLGEGGAIGSHAAVANAVADALAPLGVHVTQTPLGPNDIHEILAAAGHA